MAAFPPNDPFPGFTSHSVTPVERRRQRARDQLREASEIASLLCAGDENPNSSISAQQNGCSLPETPPEREALEDLRSITLIKDPVERGFIRREVEAKLRECPNAPRFLTPTEQSGKSKRKKGKNDCLCIHLAALAGNLEAFEALYNADPDCADLSNGTGKTVLHLAVMGDNLDLTRLICSRSPQCCNMLDFEGNLPLHLAVGETSQSNKYAHLITSAVLATYPRGMTVRNDEGLLPIHLATKYGFAAGIRALMTANTMTIYERTGVAGGQLLSVDLALMEHRRVSHQSQDDSRGTREGDTQTGTDDVQRVMNSLGGEGAVKAEGEQRETSSKRLIAPDSINLKSLFEECIEMLLMSALYFRPVFMPRNDRHDDGGDSTFFLPLHAAMVSPLTIHNWNHLFDMYGKMRASDVDRDGRTLLHAIAASCSEEERALWNECYSDDELVAMIKQVHEMNPTMHARTDGFGLIPLHLGIMCGASATVIQALVDCGRDTTKAVLIS